jgi:protoporphyrinogen oxidase
MTATAVPALEGRRRVQVVDVIGAGLSGLATAWYLTQAGVRVRVRDAGAEPGGLIQTRHVPEGLVETAARAFTWSDRVASLFNAVGLTPCDTLPESRKRFILRDGRPRRWPLSPLESVSMAAQFGRARVMRAHKPREGESVDDWGQRVLGRAATTWLLGPVLQGIYASPPRQLSAEAIFGGRRIRGKLVTASGGMGELIHRLKTTLEERGTTFEFNTTVDRLDSSVPTVICTNAPTAAVLLAPHAPGCADAIGRIRMVHLMPVTAFYAPNAADIHGFGVLFPRTSGIQALGALFNADMFPGRSSLRSETWIYGDLSADGVPRADAIGAAAAADRLRLTGRSEEAVAIHALSAPARLPVYDTAVLTAQAAMRDLPASIGITGNYLGRIGVSGILESAAETASRLVG